PNGPAILFDYCTVTWQEFDAWSNRIAHYLKDQGLVKGDAIAVLLDNRPELLAVVAGAAKVGVACAMLNTSQKGKVLAHSINLIAPKLLVVAAVLLDHAEGARSDIRIPHAYALRYLSDSNT